MDGSFAIPEAERTAQGVSAKGLQFKPFTSYKMVINGFVMVCYYSMFMFFFFMGFSLTLNLGISGHN